MNYPTTLAIFDFETAGLNPTSDKITEVAWLIVRDGVPGKVQSYLNSDIREIPLEVQRITGITPELCQTYGQRLENVLATFLMDTVELPLVGHNVVRFDALFLEAACAYYHIVQPKRERYRDTAALYKGRKLGIEQDGDNHWRYAEAILERRVWGLRYNLQAACADLGIQTDDVTLHRAAGDVTLTERLYTALTAQQVPA